MGAGFLDRNPATVDSRTWPIPVRNELVGRAAEFSRRTCVARPCDAHSLSFTLLSAGSECPGLADYDHCRRWVAAGHRVTVITCTPNCPSGIVFDGYRNEWLQEETIDGIRVLRVWTYLSPNKGFLKRITNYVSYLVSATLCAMTVRERRCDRGHVAPVLLRMGRRSVQLAFASSLVLEVRDIWPESIVTVGAIKSSSHAPSARMAGTSMYAGGRRIVTVGEGYRMRLLDRGVPPG